MILELFYIKCFTSNFLISYIKLFLFLHQMIQNCFYIERILIFYMEFLKLFLHQIILSFFTSNDSRTFHNISSPDPHGGDQPEKWKGRLHPIIEEWFFRECGLVRIPNLNLISFVWAR